MAVTKWSRGADTLIQCCPGVRILGETDTISYISGDGIFDEMCGAQATYEIERAESAGLNIITDETGRAYGYIDGITKRAVIYCDCDEQTYSETYGVPCGDEE